MPKLTTKAVIFDMDGTIVDNMHIHIDTWLIFLKQHNVHLDKSAFMKLNHGTMRQIVSRVFELDIHDPNVIRMGEAKEQFYRNTYRNNIREIPGMIKTLNQLNANGIQCALATMGHKPNIDLIIDELQIRHFFETIIGGHQVKKGKPDPEIFNLILKNLNKKPEDCIVIEDSLSGVQAARNANIKTIGITTTHTKEELMDHGCITAISDYNDHNLMLYF